LGRCALETLQQALLGILGEADRRAELTQAGGSGGSGGGGLAACTYVIVT
jgi:hypothetical protein